MKRRKFIRSCAVAGVVGVVGVPAARAVITGVDFAEPGGDFTVLRFPPDDYIEPLSGHMAEKMNRIWRECMRGGNKPDLIWVGEKLPGGRNEWWRNWK